MRKKTIKPVTDLQILGAVQECGGRASLQSIAVMLGTYAYGEEFQKQIRGLHERSNLGQVADGPEFGHYFITSEGIDALRAAA